MYIKYQPAFENPIGLAITGFFGFCSMFALGVGLLNFGRYGYFPPVDFFWSCWALLVFWNLKIELGNESGSWVYIVRLFGIVCIRREFDSISVKKDGKIYSVIGINNAQHQKTWIGGDEEFAKTHLPALS